MSKKEENKSVDQIVSEDTKDYRLNKILRNKEAKENLTKEEWGLYVSSAHSNEPEIPLENQAVLFELFLAGYTTAQINKVKPEYSMGSILKARVDGLWDHKRDLYRNQMLKNVKGRVQQAAIESTNFIIDLLMVTHKQHGKGIREYLETGDETKIKDFGIKNIRNYKDTMELLLQITGVANQKKVSGEIIHKHEVEGKTLDSVKNVSSSQASKVLEILTDFSEDKKNKEKELEDSSDFQRLLGDGKET